MWWWDGWEAAGYTVRRLSSQAVYDDPADLVELAVPETAGHLGRQPARIELRRPPGRT